MFEQIHHRVSCILEIFKRARANGGVGTHELISSIYSVHTCQSRRVLIVSYAELPVGYCRISCFSSGA